MKIADIIKNSSKYTFASIAGTIISIPKNIIIGMMVAPWEFGIFSLLWLLFDFFSYLNPGFLGASTREMTYCLAKGTDKDLEDAERVEKIGNFADFVYSAVVTLGLIVAAFFFSATYVRIGLIFVAFWFFFHKLNTYFYNANYLRENFNVTAVSRFIFGGIGALITGVLVFFIGGYALIVGNVVSNVISLGYYFCKAKYKISFKIDLKQSMIFLKTGFAISFAVFTINAFKLVDKAVISFSLSIHELGLFSFATLFVFFPHLAMQDFGNVLMPSLWKSWGNKDAKELALTSRRFAYFISVASALIALFSNLFFYFVVTKLTTKYASAFTFFNIYSFNIYFMGVIIMPNIMLSSKNINKAWFSSVVMGIGFTVNFAGDFIAAKLGYGITGIVIVSVVTQSLISLILYVKLLKYFAGTLFKRIAFIFKLYFPAFVNMVFTALFYFYIADKTHFYKGFIFSAFFSFGLWFIIIITVYKDVITFQSLKNIFFKSKPSAK